MCVILIGSRKVRLELGQECLDALDNVDGVCARAAAECSRITAGVVFIQAACALFSTPFTTLATSLTQDRRAIALCDQDIVIVAGDSDLIVGVDLIVLARAVKVSLRRIHAGLRQSGANILQVDAVRRKRDRD